MDVEVRIVNWEYENAGKNVVTILSLKILDMVSLHELDMCETRMPPATAKYAKITKSSF